ncbi:antibiotic biosynthesis monooxygenase [Pseudohongiella acticola]|uniref:Antibiotic biosynthesis monooxygenase n=1 Tax=Pseudohongiella acticola TaxID=1524254 RepID=A0A1E8CM24_9GAMM|nr:putative quinol monooxygenase [Pseudohongiella acticola]OFE13478.1 antibiotic biosynthesis monooxygenase [Pseudohongiella acticola]
MPRITLKGHIVVPDHDLQAVMAELPAHITLTRQEEGCLLFEVHQDPDTPNFFSVHEEFTDRAAFDTHQQRIQTSDWGRVASSAERHYEITETE